MHNEANLHRQGGVTLIEALVAIGIFSFGILGLIGLQATAINASSDAKNRADAIILIDSLIGQLTVAEATDLATYEHMPDGNACNPGGAASAAVPVTAWLTQVAKTLPGADANKQQIKVDTANRVVTVNICWQPKDGRSRQHSVVTQMQWQ